MSAQSTRNTSIRTRKMRGEDSLLSSISIAEREGEPEGIADVIRCEEPFSDHQYGTAVPGKKASRGPFGAGLGDFGAKPGLDVLDVMGTSMFFLLPSAKGVVAWASYPGSLGPP